MPDSLTIEKKKISEVPFKKSGFRWGFSAMSATSVDYIVTALFKEVFGVYLHIANLIGPLSGGLVSFLLGRNWAFFNRVNSISGQAGRYLLANIGSIILNWSGVFVLTGIISENNFWIAKVLIGACVGLFYNFPVQRYFVFRKR